MPGISKRKREAKIKYMGDHKEFLKRISKTLYYGQLPSIPCLSMPLTELSCELWSEVQRGRSLRRLHLDDAADLVRGACVSPCALVLAILYLERLKSCNPDYLQKVAPAELFVVSLMIGNKFLQDDGEDEQVVCTDWATSAGLDLVSLLRLEFEFLRAIEWNIFVNDESFESCLLWIEKQIALKQANLRGYFTYSDLVATYDNVQLYELIKSFSFTCFAATFGYFTSLMAFVTSTIVIYHIWLPYIQYVATPISITSAVANVDINMTTSETNINPTINEINGALSSDEFISEELLTIQLEKIKCCSHWLEVHHYGENSMKAKWFDGIVVNRWKSSYDSWWSRTKSVLDWLHRSSSITPLKRWLEKINRYSDFITAEIFSVSSDTILKYQKRCDRSHNCMRHGLNLSKLLVVSLSDR